jgi:pyruvate ferredoxin oxidoreductase delta subunit
MTENKINSKTPYQDLTIAGNIYTAGNAKEFKTGDWRSITPYYDVEKCKQCGLCWPVCPDDAIPIKDGKRLDFNYDACKGCGVCAKVCPFKAIEMK